MTIQLTPTTVMRATMCACCGNPTGGTHPQDDPPTWRYCDGCKGLSAPYTRDGTVAHNHTNVDGQPPRVMYGDDPYHRDHRIRELGGQPLVALAHDLDLDHDEEQTGGFRCPGCGGQDFTLAWYERHYVYRSTEYDEDDADQVYFDTHNPDSGDSDAYEATCDQCGRTVPWDFA